MKKLTQKQQQMLNNYNNSDMYSLQDLYKTCSVAKTRAEYLIKEEMRKIGGYGYKVCGGNSNCFTCAYCYDSRENGNINTHLVYHTAYNRYDFIFKVVE